jgi:hypothetical protein
MGTNTMRDPDGREDIDRRSLDRENTHQQNEDRQYDEGVGPLQRYFDNPHLVLTPDANPYGQQVACPPCLGREKRGLRGAAYDSAALLGTPAANQTLASSSRPEG